MEKVRFGIIGVGIMGSSHITNFISGHIKNGVISAICDIDEEKLNKQKKILGEDVKCYSCADELIKSDDVDAILIATPHYLHPVLAQIGFSCGKHILSEKPAGVYTKAVKQMNEAAKKSNKTFSLMFNQRTNPVYKTAKKMIDNGEIGEIRRINWIITDWFRSQYYYDSGDWRATWSGEGGGVLINQCPHQLDLLQWLIGLPQTVYANCSYGKYHNIEVEDDVMAIFEYSNGATGTFVTTTGEAPGTNRLEITGDMGKLIIENDVIVFHRNAISTNIHIKTAIDGFSKQNIYKSDIKINGVYTSHSGIVNNFIENILDGTPLLVDGTEGIKGLSISNAIHLSSWTGKKINLPLSNSDEDLYYDLLQEKIKTSTFIKPKPNDNSGMGSYAYDINPRKK